MYVYQKRPSRTLGLGFLSGCCTDVVGRLEGAAWNSWLCELGTELTIPSIYLCYHYQLLWEDQL